MARMINHVGRIKTTGKKCIVAYKTLPGDAYHCLVILTENLPDAQHDSLINLVESNAGQAAFEFAEALARSFFTDGSTMLPALHTQNRLIKVPTDMVEMTPTTSAVVMLSELNQLIAEQRGISVNDLAMKSGIVPEEPLAQVSEVAQPTPVITDEQLAQQYRANAARLLEEAERYNKMAADLEPQVAQVETPVVEQVVAPVSNTVDSAAKTTSNSTTATTKKTATTAKKPAAQTKTVSAKTTAITNSSVISVA